MLTKNGPIYSTETDPTLTLVWLRERSRNIHVIRIAPIHLTAVASQWNLHKVLGISWWQDHLNHTSYRHQAAQVFLVIAQISSISVGEIEFSEPFVFVTSNYLLSLHYINFSILCDLASWKWPHETGRGEVLWRLCQVTKFILLEKQSQL